MTEISVIIFNLHRLRGVQKLRLQKEGGRWSKNRLFVNFHIIENVNGGGVGGQKKPNCVNVVCERPLVQAFILSIYLDVKMAEPEKLP